MDKNESEYKIYVINIGLTFVLRMLGSVDIDGQVRMDEGKILLASLQNEVFLIGTKLNQTYWDGVAFERQVCFLGSTRREQNIHL